MDGVCRTQTTFSRERSNKARLSTQKEMRKNKVTTPSDVWEWIMTLAVLTRISYKILNCTFAVSDRCTLSTQKLLVETHTSGDWKTPMSIHAEDIRSNFTLSWCARDGTYPIEPLLTHRPPFGTTNGPIAQLDDTASKWRKSFGYISRSELFDRATRWLEASKITKIKNYWCVIISDCCPK